MPWKMGHQGLQLGLSSAQAGLGVFTTSLLCRSILEVAASPFLPLSCTSLSLVCLGLAELLSSWLSEVSRVGVTSPSLLAASTLELSILSQHMLAFSWTINLAIDKKSALVILVG